MPARAPADPPAPLPAELAEPAVRAMRRSLLAWYESEGRHLAFRATTDPWAVLVAEVMAQQTQAERAAVAWSAFLARFPTPQALADASPAEVLRAWRGLGYNRRAVALQRAARTLVEAHGGRVPADVEVLETLPGIGPYTARAVAAIAFGIPVAAVDVNVARVVGRLVGEGEGEGEGPDRRTVRAVAERLVDRGRPGAWTHAIMDLGATRCRPRRPVCDACPIAGWCASRGLEAPGRTGARVASGSVREGSLPFRRSNRWLRGRIVDRLREAADGEWVRLDGPIGEHPEVAVAEAIAGLADEGLLERRAPGGLEARLPGGTG